jgi:hypothetical protein
MSNRSKRQSIFQVCANAASLLTESCEKIYFCPICGKDFYEDSAINGVLTLEDVPPRSMGGKGLLLTCKNCNSKSGHNIDYHIANLHKLQNFEKTLTGQSHGQKTTANFKLNGDNYPITVERENSKIDIKLRQYDQKKIEKIKEYMSSVTNSDGLDDFVFNVEKSVKLDYRLLKIAYLKSSFLLITALLGYKYAFDKRLDIVRDQILNPDRNILSTSFWVDLTNCSTFPKRCLLFVSDPLNMIVVIYDSCGVILPSPLTSGDFYSDVKNTWQRGQSINFTGKIYDWPQKPLMILDNHG